MTELENFSISSEEKACDGKKSSVDEPFIVIFSSESRKE